MGPMKGRPASRRPVEPFGEQPHTRGRGRVGEDEAVAWLERHGYRIVERNVTNKAGEIDVVARDGETLCFIEVKARQTDRFGPAIEGVTPAKQRRLVRTASLYLALAGLDDVACRFDVLGLDADPDGSWRFTLIRDAFQAG